MVSNPKRIKLHPQNAGAQTKKSPIKNSPINIPQTLSGMLRTSVDNPTILSIKNIHMIQQALMKRMAGDTQSQKKPISSHIIPNHLTQTWSWWIDDSNIPIYIHKPYFRLFETYNPQCHLLIWHSYGKWLRMFIICKSLSHWTKLN